MELFILWGAGKSKECIPSRYVIYLGEICKRSTFKIKQNSEGW